MMLKKFWHRGEGKKISDVLEVSRYMNGTSATVWHSYTATMISMIFDEGVLTATSWMISHADSLSLERSCFLSFFTAQ